MEFVYLLESTEGSQDRATDPDTVLPFRWSHHFDLHTAWSQRSDLFTHPITNPTEHCGSTTEHNVPIKILPDVHITFHD